MIMLDQFKKPDGTTDWAAYHDAQVNAGETCYECGHYIIFSDGKGKRKCADCRSLDSDEGAVDHSDKVRCPKCRHQMNISESELWSLYEDGEHDVSCRHCDHDFVVVTSVSYSFESPELIDETTATDKRASE